MKGGIFIGICVGSGVLFLVIVIVGFKCARKRRKRTPIEFLAPSEQPLLGEADGAEEQYQAGDDTGRNQEDSCTGHGYVADHDTMMSLDTAPILPDHYSGDDFAERCRYPTGKQSEALINNREHFEPARKCFSKSSTGYNNQQDGECRNVSPEKIDSRLLNRGRFGSASRLSSRSVEHRHISPDKIDSVLLHSYGDGTRRQSVRHDQNEFFPSNYSEHNSSLSPEKLESMILNNNNEMKEAVPRPHDDMILRRMTSSSRRPSIKHPQQHHVIKRRSQSAGEHVTDAAPEFTDRRDKLDRHRNTGYWRWHSHDPAQVAGIPTYPPGMREHFTERPDEAVDHHRYSTQGDKRWSVNAPSSRPSTRRHSVKEVVDSIKQKRSFNDAAAYGINANEYYSRLPSREVQYYSYPLEAEDEMSHRQYHANGQTQRRQSLSLHAGEYSEPNIGYMYYDSMQQPFMLGPVPSQRTPDLQFRHDSSIDYSALQSPPPLPPPPQSPKLSPPSKHRLRPPPLNHPPTLLQIPMNPYLTPPSQHGLRSPPPKLPPTPPPLPNWPTYIDLASPPYPSVTMVSPMSSLPSPSKSVDLRSPPPVGAMMSPNPEQDWLSSFHGVINPYLEPDELPDANGVSNTILDYDRSSGIHEVTDTTLEHGRLSVVPGMTFGSFSEQQMTNHALPPPPIPSQSTVINQSSMPYNIPASQNTIMAQSEHAQPQYAPAPPPPTPPPTPNKRWAKQMLINSQGTLHHPTAGTSGTQSKPLTKPVLINSADPGVTRIRKNSLLPPPTPPPHLSTDQPFLLNQSTQHTPYRTPLTSPKQSGKPQRTAMTTLSTQAPSKPVGKPVMLPSPEKQQSPSHPNQGSYSNADSSFAPLNKVRFTSYSSNRSSTDETAQTVSNPKSPSSPAIPRSPRAAKPGVLQPQANVIESVQTGPQPPPLQSMFSHFSPPASSRPFSSPTKPFAKPMLPSPVAEIGSRCGEGCVPQPSPPREPISSRSKARIHVSLRGQNEPTTDSEEHTTVINIKANTTPGLSQSHFPRRHSVATEKDNHKLFDASPSSSKSPKRHIIAIEIGQNFNVSPTPYKSPNRRCSSVAEKSPRFGISPSQRELPRAPAPSPVSCFMFPDYLPPTPENVEQTLANPKHAAVASPTHMGNFYTDPSEEASPRKESPTNNSVENILDKISDEDMLAGNPPNMSAVVSSCEQERRISKSDFNKPGLASTPKHGRVVMGQDRTEDSLIHERLLKRRQCLADSEALINASTSEESWPSS